MSKSNVFRKLSMYFKQSKFYFILNFNSISISWGTKNSYLSTKLIAYFKRYALKKTRYKWTSVGKIVIRGRRCKRFFVDDKNPFIVM